MNMYVYCTPNRTTMRVTAILKGRNDANGKQAVNIRTNTGRVRSFRALKIRVSPGEWDASKGRVKTSHPKHNEYNSIIKKKIVEMELSAIEGQSNYSTMMLSTYCTRSIDAWESTKATETLRGYRSEVNKLLMRLGDYQLSALTVFHLEKYKDNIFAAGNTRNTVWRSLKFLRTIIRKAHREGLIRENIFNRFEMVIYKNPEKQFLIDKQVDKIEEYSLDPKTPKHLQFSARWFVLGCRTGLRYGDMNKFDKQKNIIGGRLVLYTSKTGELVSIKLKDRLKQLLEAVQYSPLHLTNQAYNSNLKDIQRHCGLKINLTAHVSRHTFGVYCAENGLGIDATAKLMGHRDTKTTSVYYKISNLAIDKEVDKLFD